MDQGIGPSMIFNGKEWVKPPSTSSETGNTQQLYPRYV